MIQLLMRIEVNNEIEMSAPSIILTRRKIQKQDLRIKVRLEKLPMDTFIKEDLGSKDSLNGTLKSQSYFIRTLVGAVI